MKKFKLMALVLAAGMTINVGLQAKAEVGYLNYQKVLDNYEYLYYLLDKDI